ncbi:hypothetical protein ABPG77_009335 [Micractinium sp. CCAP 211/92]
MAEQPTRLPASHAPLQAALPIDVLRIVLAALLGEERQDAYVLVRPLASFMRVCKAWREAALTTPLSMNIDYLAGELPTAAVRWLQRMTFADLQVNPGMPINRVLTHPDFAARNSAVLTRLWGAAVATAVPGRWPQFRHFPRLEILELSCDHYAAPPAAGGQQPDLQRFESRMLAPLTSLKCLSLREFGSADLSRLPPSLETLHLDIYTALPLVLPERLRLQELALAATRLLVDWPRLCSQVENLITIDTPSLEVLAQEGAGDVFSQVAEGFKQGCVAEMDIVAQEVALVLLPPELRQSQYARRIPEDLYQPEVLEAVHIVTLAADLQANHFRSLGCIYNPDDIQTDEELGLTDGVTVRLHRFKPGEPQVLGFCYSLSEEQMSYLLSEAAVGGLSLEAMERGDLEALLNHEEFQRRCGPTLAWLQGLDLFSSLQLGAYPELQRLECYVLPQEESLEAVCQLPGGLTSLDMCGVAAEEVDVTDRNSWPSFVPGPDPQHGWDTRLSLARLGGLKELSLRYFREVRLDELLPPSVEALTIECLRPRSAVVGGAQTNQDIDFFDFSLPPLNATGQEGLPAGEPRVRTLTLQFHRTQDYRLQRPALFLQQLLHAATHLAVSVTSDPPPVPPEGADEQEEQELAGNKHTCLVLAAGHGTLKEALDAITDSALQSIDLEADEVLFTDDNFATFTSSRTVLAFIRQHYSHAWLVWEHHPEDPEEEAEAGGTPGGGFTMRRKQG